MNTTNATRLGAKVFVEKVVGQFPSLEKLNNIGIVGIISCFFTFVTIAAVIRNMMKRSNSQMISALEQHVSTVDGGAVVDRLLALSYTTSSTDISNPSEDKRQAEDNV